MSISKMYGTVTEMSSKILNHAALAFLYWRHNFYMISLIAMMYFRILFLALSLNILLTTLLFTFCACETSILTFFKGCLVHCLMQDRCLRAKTC